MGLASQGREQSLEWKNKIFMSNGTSLSNKFAEFNQNKWSITLQDMNIYTNWAYFKKGDKLEN